MKKNFLPEDIDRVFTLALDGESMVQQSPPSRFYRESRFRQATYLVACTGGKVSGVFPLSLEGNKIDRTTKSFPSSFLRLFAFVFVRGVKF